MVGHNRLVRADCWAALSRWDNASSSFCSGSGFSVMDSSQARIAREFAAATEGLARTRRNPTTGHGPDRSSMLAGRGSIVRSLAGTTDRYQLEIRPQLPWRLFGVCAGFLCLAAD